MEEKTNKGENMNFNDKPAFAEKLKEISRVVGRQIEEADVEAYYNQLDEYPVDLVTRAMDLALKSRDPDDMFTMNMLPTVPEIQAAITALLRPAEEEAKGTVASCPICSGNGWISSGGVAWPCKCLYEAAKEALKRKKRVGSEEVRLDVYRKRIVGAFERHDKNWGGEK